MTKARGLFRGGAAVAVAAVLLAGCMSSGDSDKTASSGDGKGSSTGVVAPLVDLSETIGDPVEFQVPGSSQDTVTVGVIGLEVDGKIQVLHLVFTPHFASRSNDASISLYDMISGTGFHPQLVDRSNLKIYSSVRSSSSTGTRVANGQPMYVYAVFAAPEDEGAVDFDLQLDSSWVPVTVRAEER